MSRILGCSLLLITFLGAGPVEADTASTKASKFVLELGSARVEADEAVVLSEKIGDGRDVNIQKPTPGKTDEIALRGGAAMAKDLVKQLEEGFTKECVRRVEASLVFAGRDYTEISRLTFSWGLITEVGLPSLDATSKESATITIKLQPQFPRRILQQGEPLKKPSTGPSWNRAAFKLSIDGLDGALPSVRQVSELRVVQVPTTSAPIHCGSATVSDLSFTIPSSDAAGLGAWKDGAMKTGTLEYLAVDGSTILRAKLHGLKKKSQVSEGATTSVTASVESVGFDSGAHKDTPAKK